MGVLLFQFVLKVSPDITRSLGALKSLGTAGLEDTISEELEADGWLDEILL